jgi:hypothetical protein
MVELSKKLTELGLLRMEFGNPRSSEAVKNSKLFLTEPFVYDERFVLGKGHSTLFSYQLTRELRSQIRRSHHDIGPNRFCLRRKPPSQRGGLLFPEAAQGYVHISMGDVDTSEACSVRRVAGNVSRALTVTDDPQSARPTLLHLARFLTTIHPKFLKPDFMCTNDDQLPGQQLAKIREHAKGSQDRRGC